jgi:hypothetical protein
MAGQPEALVRTSALMVATLATFFAAITILHGPSGRKEEGKMKLQLEGKSLLLRRFVLQRT